MLKKLGWGVGAIVVLVLVAAAWFLGPALFSPTNMEAGETLGERVPVDMELRNENGRVASISDVAGENGTVLVMVRSADWCPFCVAQLKDHAAIAEEIKAQGYRLVGLSYDEPELLADFATEQEIPYALLSDTESRFIDAVGLRDPQYGEGHVAEGVPRASVLVIAPDGTLQAKFVSEDYRQRPSNEQVLELIASGS
ncbi:peroxiredoxin family protein [Erythrobacter sp. HA6-11]